MKTEVFIAYDDNSSVMQLEETLDAWDTVWAEPVAIHVTNKDNETLVKVAAEAIAKEDYMIVPLGSSPNKTSTYEFIKKGSIKVEPCQPRVQ
jgi:hypothetical protein